MSYNMHFAAMPGPALLGNMSNPQIYGDEEIMGIQPFWVENIDPLLRDQTQGPSLGLQEQPLQRFLVEPQKNFFTTDIITNFGPQSFPQNFNGSYEPTSSLPNAVRDRMDSPSPSAQELSSICSSVRSPPTDVEYHSENYYSSHTHDDYSSPNTTPRLSHRLPDLWRGQPQIHVFPRISGYPCVNLSQIQVLPDPQEVTFEADEGYMEMEMQTEHSIEVDHRAVKSEDIHVHYSHSSDEGLGASIKGERSPPHTNSTQTDIDADADADADADTDADAEAEDDIEVDTSQVITLEAEEDDTEYNPRSSRSRKRRAAKPSSPVSSNRVQTGRVTKAGSPKSKSQFSCKSCSHAAFKDANALARHTASLHTRAFICVFGFAGCPSTFASKNEWKRHVSSQHLNLNYWQCDLGQCGKVQSSKSNVTVVKGAEFNRKDLFTQHLRRMHAPFAVKRQNKKHPEWEARVKDLQSSALKQRRQAPTRLRCPVRECESVFEGLSTWDDRMEHVGKHLEKASSAGSNNKVIVEQEADDFLVGWALKEKIIERKSSGGYRLCGNWKDKREYEDVDGEEE